MAITILNDESWFNDDRSTGLVVMEDDGTDFAAAIERLQNAEVRKDALAFAVQKGCYNPGISGSTSPYPVNPDGLPLDHRSLTDARGNPLPYSDPRMRVTRYRVSVPVQKGF